MGAGDAAPFLLPTTIKSVAKHLLLFAATTGYQIRVFADAARRLGVDVTLATDRCHILDDPWGDRAIAVKFDQIEESLKAIRGLRVDGVAAVGDRPAVLAAAAAEMLGVPFHPEAAARACHDKHISRELFRAAGMRVPCILSRQPAGRCRGAGGARAVSLRVEAAGTLGQPRRDPRQRSGRVRGGVPADREDGRARVAGGGLHSGARVRGGRT